MDYVIVVFRHRDKLVFDKCITGFSSRAEAQHYADQVLEANGDCAIIEAFNVDRPRLTKGEQYGTDLDDADLR